jgi:hypothetical protein
MKFMLQHTLGPWKTGSMSQDNGIEIHYAGNDHRWHVATAYGQVDETVSLKTTQGHASANARLIAAAPEMLAVLKEVEKQSRKRLPIKKATWLKIVDIIGKVRRSYETAD